MAANCKRKAGIYVPSDGRTYHHHHLRSNLALKLNLDLIKALDFTVNYTESTEVQLAQSKLGNHRTNEVISSTNKLQGKNGSREAGMWRTHRLKDTATNHNVWVTCTY